MLTSTQTQMLRLLARSGPMSRTMLAGGSGLSKPAVTVVMRELVGLGFVEEAARPDGSKGTSRPMAIRGEAACFAGVSLAERDAVLVLSDLVGKTLGQMTVSVGTRAGDWTPETLVEAIGGALPELLAGHATAPSGVGVAVPGFVDLAGKRCRQSTRLGWTNVPLAALLQERLGLPVRLENDAHALARGMQMSSRMSSFSLVSVDQGIGCGHIVDGRLLRGRHGGAGEIAHVTLRPGGLPCRCGKRGCLDTLSSLRALADVARASRMATNPAALQRQADAGFGAAVRLLQDGGSALGLAIAQMIQCLDPGKVLIGLDPALATGVYGVTACRAIAANVLDGFAGSATGEPIGFVTVAPSAWAEGAAGVAAHRYLWGADE